ncbi:branched-chain amino acid ABC transporter permease [Guggenheimella bovis]
MTLFLQYLINGIALGSVYALMAVGYSLVYSIMNFSNFAHGGVIMLGSYIGYYSMLLLKFPLWLTIILSMLGGLIIAVAVERFAYNPLRKRNAPSLYYIISAMGVSIFLENIVVATIGPNFKRYPDIFEVPFVSLGSLSIGKVDMIILLISVVSLLALMFLIEKTKTGMAIRSTSFNMRAASLMGVNTEFIIFLVFGLGGAFAGLAGVLFGLRYLVYPSIGVITNKAFVAAVFGGLGSLPGAIVGAVLLGIIETMAAAYISSNLQNIIAFVLLIIVLVVRPQGIMGKITEDKA